MVCRSSDLWAPFQQHLALRLRFWKRQSMTDHTLSISAAFPSHNDRHGGDDKEHQKVPTCPKREYRRDARRTKSDL